MVIWGPLSLRGVLFWRFQRVLASRKFPCAEGTPPTYELPIHRRQPRPILSPGLLSYWGFWNKNSIKPPLFLYTLFWPLKGPTAFEVLTNTSAYLTFLFFFFLDTWGRRARCFLFFFNFDFYYYFILLAKPRGMWNLSSLTRDQTYVPYILSSES